MRYRWGINFRHLLRKHRAAASRKPLFAFRAVIYIYQESMRGQDDCFLKLIEVRYHF
jgi:hypothetical protein